MGSSRYSNEQKSNCIYYGYIDYVKQEKQRAFSCGNGEEFLKVISYLKRDNTMTDCALRLIDSEQRKYKKLRDKIDKLVSSGQAIFITLTFTDEILTKTSALTRRRYVARYLKQQSPFYVANIDFSPDKNREHYHAVVSSRCDLSQWVYGFTFAEQVRVHDFDRNRVARYVAKLTNHALKVKQVSQRLIYSRDVI